jgi:hypothetical protein
MFSHGTRNYSLLQRRVAAVPDDVEKLGSWEAQPPFFFGRATLMRSTKSKIYTSPC